MTGKSSAGGWLDYAADGAEGLAAGADFVERADLLHFQLGYFLRAGPHDRPTAVMGLKRELVRLGFGNSERLAQHLDHEFERVVVIIFENHVVRRHAARPRLILGPRLRDDDRIG